MDISAYLIELLRLHDCVIVPDLGGFVTNYHPADIDLAGNSFSPPRKEIIFSAMLKKNDGLLVSHISESEGIGYLEARLMVTEFVEETQSKLENGETIELPMIGSLKYDRNEKLIFEPDVKENLLLEVYGLESFQFPPLKHHEILIPKRHLHNKEAVKPVFASRRMKTLAITIPVLLALLIIPVKKSSLDQLNPFNYQTSNTAPLALNQTPTPAMVKPSEINSNAASGTVKIAGEAQVVQKTAEPSNAGKKEVAPQVTAIKKYHLIGGCFKMKENAEKLLHHLQAEGFQSVMNQAPSGNYIVTIQSYAGKDEAVMALKTLRDQEPNAGYWMSVKNER